MKKAMLIQVPGSFGKKLKNIPQGLLAVASMLRLNSIESEVVDLCLTDMDILLERVKISRPHIIGFGGIATSFTSAKEVSVALHKYCPDSVYIAGGPLSSTYDLLLEDRIVDYVFHGEVERSLPKFLNFLDSGKGLNEVGGISFRKEKLEELRICEDTLSLYRQTDRVLRSKPEEQISDLDNCGLFDYGLINLKDYIYDLKDWYEDNREEITRIKKLDTKVKRLISEGKTTYLGLTASRGCTHRCKFCYRHVKGIRRNSVNFLLKHIELLKSYCAIDGLNFVDELFNNDINWVHNFCDVLSTCGLGISFYMVAGMRSDNINERLIERMSNSGCVSMSFGQESGSQDVLKFYGKGVSVEENINSVLLTRRFGINTSIQLVIGSPVETNRTIRQTRNFLKTTDARTASINYIIPLPETPVWEDVLKRNLIKDIRGYLDNVKKNAGSYYMRLNISKVNKIMWLFWYISLERQILLNRHKNNLLQRLYYQTYLYKIVLLIRKILGKTTASLATILISGGLT